VEPRLHIAAYLKLLFWYFSAEREELRSLQLAATAGKPVCLTRARSENELQKRQTRGRGAESEGNDRHVDMWGE
jgi:hypothetical protein